MSNYNNKRIVIKIGSNVLTTSSGALDLVVISDIVDQIALLKSKGYKVVLVSSGAVAAGKSIYKLNKKIEDQTTRRQIYSSIGQVKLMSLYAEKFATHQLICSQVLATKEDFIGGDHYKNMKNCFKGLLRDNIIPIVNENDVVSLSEIMFTDNDELAGLTAFLIKAERLIILSNIEGLYDGHPEEEDSSVIESIAIEKDFSHVVQDTKSSAGRGGMASKYDVGKRTAEKGITTTIANGKNPGVILDIVEGEMIGTTFEPNEDRDL